MVAKYHEKNWSRFQLQVGCRTHELDIRNEHQNNAQFDVVTWQVCAAAFLVFVGHVAVQMQQQQFVAQIKVFLLKSRIPSN